MIKPQDVTDELVNHYLRSYVSKSWPEKIARDMNAAIEAGLVVPASEAKVLRRALRLACQDTATYDEWNDQDWIGTPELYLERARRELESEGNDERKAVPQHED